MEYKRPIIVSCSPLLSLLSTISLEEYTRIQKDYLLTSIHCILLLFPIGECAVETTDTGREVTDCYPSQEQTLPITFSRALTKNDDLWSWRDLVANGYVEEAKTNCTITLDDRNYYGTISWSISDVFPVQIAIDTHQVMHSSHNHIPTLEELEEELRVTSDTPEETMSEDERAFFEDQMYINDKKLKEQARHKKQEELLDRKMKGYAYDTKKEYQHGEDAGTYRMIVQERLVLLHTGIRRTC